MLNSKLILYAEDNENDALLMQMALQRSSPDVLLHCVADGQEAISYLSGEGKYANRSEFSLPAFLLLDIKMPRVNGIEVLSWVRMQSAFKHIPIVMMTASLEIKDQERCYELGVNSFLVKPSDMNELIILSGLMANYWLQWNRTTHIAARRS